jgi:hypothetical protein
MAFGHFWDDYNWFSGVLKTIGAKKNQKQKRRLISRRGCYTLGFLEAALVAARADSI